MGHGYNGHVVDDSGHRRSFLEFFGRADATLNRKHDFRETSWIALVPISWTAYFGWSVIDDQQPVVLDKFLAVGPDPEIDKNKLLPERD